MNNNIRFSHGAYKPYVNHPHATHTDLQLDHRKNQELQASPKQHTHRYQRRHPQECSKPMSDTQKKIWAIFFIFLLSSNDSSSSYALKRTDYQSKPKNIPQKSNEPTRKQPHQIVNLHSLIFRGISALGSNFLVFPQASALAMPYEPSDFGFFNSNDLGPVGKFLAREGAERAKYFNTYVKENPKEAGFILEVSSYVFSMIRGASIGAQAGPWTAVAGALSGLGVSFITDCGGKGFREMIGREQFDLYIGKAIDMVSIPVRTVFPSLSQTGARLAVSEATLLAFTFLHMKSIGVAVSEGAFVVGIEEMIANGIKEGTSNQFEHYSTFELHTEQNPEGSAIDQLLHRVQQDIMEELAHSVEDIVHKVKKTTQKPSKTEKNQDTAAATQETINIQQAVKHFVQTADIGSNIAFLLGNHKLAQDIKIGSQSIAGLVQGFDQLIFASLSGAGPLAFLGPVGLISGALVGISSLFSSDAENGVSKQLSEVYQALSQQIAESTLKVLKSIQELSEKIDIVDYHVIWGFAHLEQEAKDQHAVTSASLQRVESWLQELIHVLLPEVHELTFKGITETCLAIDDFSKGLGSLEKIEEKDFRSYARILENGLRGVSPYHEFSNGFLFDVTSPEARIRVSKSPSPEAFLGFWDNFVESVLHIPTGIDPRTIPNLEMFLHSLSRYLTLRQEASLIPWDDQGTLLREVCEAAKPLITFPQFMQNNSLVIKKLLTDIYQPAFEAVKTDFSQGFSRVSDALLNEVHQKIVKMNQDKIEQFPAYPNWPDFTRYNSVHWPNVANPILSRLHKKIKSDLVPLVDPNILKKGPLKISIDRSREDLLSSVDTSVLNGIVAPKSGQPGHLLPIPLSLLQLKTQTRSAIANYIPKVAYLDQGLGLGTIECQYVQTSDEAGKLLDKVNGEIAVWEKESDKYDHNHNGRGSSPKPVNPLHNPTTFHNALSQSGETISLQITFKKNDGSVLPLGTVTLTGASTINIESFFPHDKYAIMNLDHTEQLYLGMVDILSPLVYRFSPHRLKSIWENANVQNTTPVDSASTNSLLALADEELVKLRKKGLSSLYAANGEGYAPTEKGEQLRQHMELLNAAKSPLGPLTTIAGFSKSEQEELLALPNGEIVFSDHKQYLEKGVTADTPFMPQLPKGGLEPILSRVVARYTTEPKGNPFSEPVQRQLATLGSFLKGYPEIVHQREEKIKQKASVEKERTSSRMAEEKIDELTRKLDKLTALLAHLNITN